MRLQPKSHGFKTLGTLDEQAESEIINSPDYRPGDLARAIADEEPLSAGDLLMDVMAQIESPKPWMPTGVNRLDYYLDGGLRGGEVMVLAARPRVGKSALALQIALHVAEAGHPVVIWSLEMRPEQWMRRALSALSAVPLKKIRQGIDTMTDHDMTGIAEAARILNALPLIFASPSCPTDPKSFDIETAKHVMLHGAKLVIVDYVQLMDPPDGAFSRENEVAQISKGLKRTAMKRDVPILMLAQIRRDAEGKVPALSDLRESGSLEQDADTVLFLHRETDPDKHVLQDRGMLVLAKNRDGESGSFPVTYNWMRFRFEEMR
jgi:replicative DNA helicase